MTVQGNIDVLTVNGIDLRNKLLTRHTAQTIRAPYRFVNVQTQDRVVIKGLYNGVNLNNFASMGLLADGTIFG